MNPWDMFREVLAKMPIEVLLVQTPSNEMWAQMQEWCEALQ